MPLYVKNTFTPDHLAKLQLEAEDKFSYLTGKFVAEGKISKEIEETEDADGNRVVIREVFSKEAADEWVARLHQFFAENKEGASGFISTEIIER